MADSKSSPNIGTSKKVEQFFLDNLNQPFTRAEIIKRTNLDKNNTGVGHKLNALMYHGKIKRSKTKPYSYTAIPLHMIGKAATPSKPSKPRPPKSQLPSVPTPQANATYATLFAATTTAPLDIPELMQQIINVNEQNKIYRNALESVALLLEQAGIIETTN